MIVCLTANVTNWFADCLEIIQAGQALEFNGAKARIASTVLFATYLSVAKPREPFLNQFSLKSVAQMPTM